MMVKLLLALALIVSILIPFGAFAAGEKSRGRYKTALAVNSFLFFSFTPLKSYHNILFYCHIGK